MSETALYDRAAAPATRQPAPPPASTCFAALANGLIEACDEGARQVAALLDGGLPDTAALLAMLPESARGGSAAGYTRHLVYADPLARFSAMLLVWRPGQASPVHGHRVWCAYRVLKGSLRERHFRWDAQAGVATETGSVERRHGDTFSVPAGLRHIHALGNDSDDIAVSLHIYGVPADAIATGVNLAVRTGS